MQRNRSCDIAEIYDLLYRLGLTANSTAFFHLSFAVYLAVRTPHRLFAPSQYLYPQVAAHYQTDSLRVYRGISTLIGQLWQQSSAALRRLSYRPLPAAPTTPQLLAVLALSLRKQHSGSTS